MVHLGTRTIPSLTLLQLAQDYYAEYYQRYYADALRKMDEQQVHQAILR